MTFVVLVSFGLPRLQRDRFTQHGDRVGPGGGREEGYIGTRYSERPKAALGAHLPS